MTHLRLSDLLDKEIDSEISELNELLDILGDENSLLLNTDTGSDLSLIKNRIKMFKDFKMMIAKASLQIEGVDNVAMMTSAEKKHFHRLVRLISKVRKFFQFFRINKK
jgi:hypothetical protein